MVEAITDIFQVVMLSAIRKLSSAWPEESVTSSGFQTRVSGKYLRTRGVNACCSACTWMSRPPRTTFVTLALVVSTSGAAAVTSTVSDVWPTRREASTRVRLEELTGTAVTTELMNPGREITTLYLPAGRLFNS